MRRTTARGTRSVRVALLLGAVLSLFALAGLTPAVAGPVLAPQADPVSATKCAPNGQGETCTGTFSGDRAIDRLQPGKPEFPTNMVPTVTVNQTRNLTNQKVHVSWTNFTPSHVFPSGVGFVPGNTDYAVAIMECRGTPGVDDPEIADPAKGLGVGTSAENGSCYVLEAGGLAVSNSAGPGNLIRTFSSKDPNDDAGNGSADFQIETRDQNTFLGCSDTSTCSLVVVPNFGGTQLPGQTVNCAVHTSEDSNSGGGAFDSARDLHLGFPCSWADRIVVPLSFAPTPGDSCPVADAQFNAEGAPGLEQAMSQWQPGWCKPPTGQPAVFVDYNPGVNEFQAQRNFLSSGQAFSADTDVALGNVAASADATSSGRPFTYAPVANSAISIVYYVDDQTTGLPITNLVLNARLMAKLLTQSYALNFGNPQRCVTGTQGIGNCPEDQQCQNQTVQSQLCDPNVVGNPVDIFHDPEFQQLNPEYTLKNFITPQFPTATTNPDFLPTVLAGDSQLTFELTRWIESDPEARAFMAGQPDEWGMHINNAFKGVVTYPTSQFAAQDAGWSNFPLPGASMGITWNPVTGLDQLVQRFGGNSPNADLLNGVTCSLPQGPSPQGGCAGGVWNYPLAPAQTFGKRGLFAVVDQGSAAAFRFPTAQIMNAAGNAVAPTNVSMSAALNVMQTNPDGITQFANDNSTDPRQYPLTVTDYAMVPTCNVTQKKVTAITQFLNNVAGPAQLFGTQPGQLQEFGGYVQLTDAQKAQTQKAATEVSTQACTSPPPDKTVSGEHISTLHPPSAPGPNSGFGGSGSTASGTGAGNASGAPAAGGPGRNGTGPQSQNGANGPRSNTPLGLKSLDTGGFMALVLPVALGVGGLLALIAGATYALNATEHGRRLLNRVRRRLGIPPQVDEIGEVE